MEGQMKTSHSEIKYCPNKKLRGDSFYSKEMSADEVDAESLLKYPNLLIAKEPDVFLQLSGFLSKIARRNILFLDIETSGSARDEQVVTAVIARLNGDICLQGYASLNPTHERGLLRALASEVRTSDYIITHGGRSFDIPFLEKRYAAHSLGKSPCHHRTGQSISFRHLDLLKYARETLQAPDAKLSTFEEVHLDYVRKGDISGREIPLAYERFLHEREDRQLTAILHHNARDTLATLALFCYLILRK